MAEPPFRRVGIAGLGLIGGSIARAARATWPACEVVACDPAGDRSALFLVGEFVPDIADLAPCDLIVLAMPVSDMPRCLDVIAESGTRAVVTDVGSTKRRVMAAAAAAGLGRFVGGHPMAGGERPGFGNAKPDLFLHRPWLLVEGTADREAARRLEAFVRGLGAVVHWMDAETHDRTVAYVSHLPQIVAAALMNAAQDGVGVDGKRAAGNAFAEMTRLASSPKEMWKVVLAENEDFVREALETFLRALPTGGDPGQWAESALTRSGAARAAWRRAEPPEQ